MASIHFWTDTHIANEGNTSVTKKRIWILSSVCVLILLVPLAGLQFFFNPLGLGPVPSRVLAETFFAAPAEDLSCLVLLVDGAEAFNDTLAAIDAATSAIHIQTFIWKDDHIGRQVVAHLKAAADRGVKITVRKDMVGTVFELGDILDGKPSPVFTEAGLKEYANIDVQLEPFSDTDHSKYFIIDQQRVILGGMNIADEYHRQWHDYMAAIHSREWTRAFMARVLDGRPWPGQAPFFIAVNDRIATEIRTALIEMIDRAATSIIVEHAYFSDDLIIAALLRAGRRGVAVTLILPEIPDTHGPANKVTINRLLGQEAGQAIRVYLYPRMSHAKVALADGTMAAVGSANLTPRSMLTSREIVLFVHGRKEDGFIRRLDEQLATDMAAGTRVTKPFELGAAERLKALAGKYVW